MVNREGEGSGRARIGHDPAVVESDFWSEAGEGRVRCEVCPRRCSMREGQRGLCFVRAARNARVVLTTYGRACGLSIDPIEKKPLYHFLPGTGALSFGTAGCNLTCKYCQNWHLSRARSTDIASEHAEPEDMARLARSLGARSVAYTYNDPVVFLEYAVDTARACRALDIRSVAVTAAYILPEPRERFFGVMDAANIDLKAFSESFYRKLTGGRLGPVLETIEYVKHETNVWLELTTLLIPGENDGAAEIEALARWVVDRLGKDVPLHFSAFCPAFKMLDRPRTPRDTLVRARTIAMEQGLRYAYTGNIRDPEGSATYCHGCGELLIRREGFQSVAIGLDASGRCVRCKAACAGVLS